MRHGKHESNSPSRFVREIDRQYVSNPGAADSDETEIKPSGFGAWKQQSSSRFGNTYGQSSRPVVERRPAPARPSVQQPSSLRPVARPQALPKRVSDADFVPTPILPLKAGQRIEHNRFGFGVILEFSGDLSDLKARIRFDELGEKILILKYAKIRAV